MTQAKASPPPPPNHEAGICSIPSSSEESDTDSDASSDMGDSSNPSRLYQNLAIRVKDQEQTHTDMITLDSSEAPTVTAKTKDTLTAMSAFDTPDTARDIHFDRYKRKVKEAFQKRHPYPEDLEVEALWCFWRLLHRQADRAEPPQTPPWSPGSGLVEEVAAVQLIESEPETSDIEMSDARDSEVAWSGSSNPGVQLCYTQQTLPQQTRHVDQPEGMLNSDHTASLVPNGSSGMNTDHASDHTFVMKEAFQQDLSFPEHL